MAYKIPNFPTKNSYSEELSDFWEILCCKYPDRVLSSFNLTRIIQKESDELVIDGVESEDDFIEGHVIEAFIEIESRNNLLGAKYPFGLTETGIKFDFNRNYIYLFLLFCTRLNMTKFKIQANIDATKLFEHLCAVILLEYLGKNGQSFVFGTGSSGGFEDKVNQLIQLLGEGVSFNNPDNNSPTKNDDALDVVGWKNFSNSPEGKLMFFGQCKTGTSWRTHKNDLIPSQFCNNWFSSQPLYYPINSFFISDTLYKNYNYNSDQRGKIFFNRNRLMEYCKEEILDENLLTDIKKWVESVIKSLREENLN